MNKIDGRMIHRVKELRSQGKTQAEIAVEVGVSQGTVSVILRVQGLGGPLVKPPRKGSLYDLVSRRLAARD